MSSSESDTLCPGGCMSRKGNAGTSSVCLFLGVEAGDGVPSLPFCDFRSCEDVSVSFRGCGVSGGVSASFKSLIYSDLLSGPIERGEEALLSK